jgi:Flp pilus assembly protein TadD
VLDPEYAEANVGQGKFNQALPDYLLVTQFDPENAEIYHSRGLAYARQGHLDHAIKDYTRAIDLQPDYAQAYCDRGLAYIGKGEKDKARGDLLKVLEISADAALRQLAADRLAELDQE